MTRTAQATIRSCAILRRPIFRRATPPPILRRPFSTCDVAISTSMVRHCWRRSSQSCPLSIKAVCCIWPATSRRGRSRSISISCSKWLAIDGGCTAFPSPRRKPRPRNPKRKHHRQNRALQQHASKGSARLHRVWLKHAKFSGISWSVPYCSGVQRHRVQTGRGTYASADPVFAEAWYNLSDLLDEQGQSEAATDCLRRALGAAPDYVDAMFNLALPLQRNNKHAEAAEYCRRYLANDAQSEWAARALWCLKFCEMQVRSNSLMGR